MDSLTAEDRHKPVTSIVQRNTNNISDITKALV